MRQSSFRAMAQLHDRVAFPLPGVAVALSGERPREYLENPQTLGDHLQKCRRKRSLTQMQAAEKLGVGVFTYMGWEQGRHQPLARQYPAILAFLGYDPNPRPQTLPERLAAKRRELGLTLASAAELAGVDEGTFRMWENGEWKPRLSEEKVEGFLRATSHTGAFKGGNGNLGSRPKTY